MTCLAPDRCDACEKAWLDCKGKLTTDIKGIMQSLPSNPPQATLPPPGPPPKKQQNAKLHEIDGCTIIPDDPGGLLGGELGVPGKKTAFGDPRGTVEDVAQFGLEFPCNKHDICYQTCSNDDNHKAECDNEMFAGMLGVCEGAYPGLICPLKGLLDIYNCGNWYEEKALCLLAADAYWVGLKGLGWIFYDDRQAEYCEPVGVI